MVKKMASTNANAKFTVEEVQKIRALYGPKMGYRRLAKMFNVKPDTIRSIINRWHYKHVE